MSSSTQLIGSLTVARNVLRATRDIGLLTFAFFKVREIFYPRDVHRNRFYKSSEVAHFLGTDRKAVVRLVHDGKLKALKTNGNYKILGRDLMKYLGNGELIREGIATAPSASDT